MKLNGRRAPTDIGDNVFPPARSNMTKAADHAGPTVALNPASQYSPAARGYQSDNRLTVDSQRGGLLEAHTPPRSSASSVVSSVSGSRRPISSKHLVVAQLVVQGYTTEEAQQAVAKVGDENLLFRTTIITSIQRHVQQSFAPRSQKLSAFCLSYDQVGGWIMFQVIIFECRDALETIFIPLVSISPSMLWVRFFQV